MTDQPEWERPLTDDKIAWLQAQFARLKQVPAILAAEMPVSYRRERRQRRFWE